MTTIDAHHGIAPTIAELAEPIDSLTPWPGNPRQHDLPVIVASLRENGQYRPIVARLSDRRILAGHGTTLGARELGWSHIAVTWVDVDDQAALRILAVDNRANDLGSYDDTALAAVLSEIESLAGTGFTQADLDALLKTTAPPPVKLTDPDDAPALVTGEPITQLGDLWQLGPHQLVCGDCTDPGTVERIGGRDADLILTDPPYCSGGFQESGRSIGSVGTQATHKQIANDRLSTRGYMALMKSALGCTAAPFAYVFTDWRMWVNLFDAVESSGFGVRNMIVWDKGTPGMGRGWRAQHEIIMWASKETQPNSKHGAAHGNVVQAKRTGNRLHTTQKPVDLLRELLAVTHFAATVYDPFAGSGSTLIACHGSERHARLVELDRAYCDVILRRWQDHTGIIPTRDGQPVDFTTAHA